MVIGIAHYNGSTLAETIQKIAAEINNNGVLPDKELIPYFANIEVISWDYLAQRVLELLFLEEPPSENIPIPELNYYKIFIVNKYEAIKHRCATSEEAESYVAASDGYHSNIELVKTTRDSLKEAIIEALLSVHPEIFTYYLYKIIDHSSNSGVHWIINSSVSHCILNYIKQKGGIIINDRTSLNLPFDYIIDQNTNVKEFATTLVNSLPEIEL